MFHLGGWPVHVRTRTGLLNNEFRKKRKYIKTDNTKNSPDSFISPNNDGTIFDARTGLVWLNDASLLGKYSFDKALYAVKCVADGNYNLTDGSKPGDWRLPTSDELKTILGSGLKIIRNIQLFYWSQTTEYNVTFDISRSIHHGENYIFPVRPVQYDDNGYDHNGFGADSYDNEGYDRYGFNSAGIDREGFGRDGYDIDGYDKNGYDNNGVDRNGYTSPAKWQDVVISTTRAPYFQNEWPAVVAYSGLKDQDLALASEWANAEKDDDFTMAKMLSARTAEKIAVKFYQSLGYEVNDVSIKQPVKAAINPPCIYSNDWKLFDLLLNDIISIDVKNARTPLNSKVTYVEHCVSKFKKNRNNQNVIMAGILSPYLKLDDIKNPRGMRYEADIKYLGETTALIYSKLEERFSKRFLKLSFTAMNFIPSWMFEFPEKFYEARNQCRLQLQAVSIKQIPTIAECRVNPIPAYLSSGITLPDIWKTDLRDWQIDFYSRIRPRDNAVITMPVLFLALLTHFLEAVTQVGKWKDYNPGQYRELLYSDVSTKENWQMPLGIFDPLGTIESFIETLSILWNNKEHTNLKEFELFKFNGVGLLEGKRLGKQKYETILAYCGGFIEGKGKCGNNPLILGKHQSCPSCGKLICKKCGHCSATCLLCEDRMQNVSNDSEGVSAYHDLNHFEVKPFEDDIPEDDIFF